MVNIQVQVFTSLATLASNRRLFERIVTINDSCAFPFEIIIRALTYLFGQGVIINFQILTK